MKINAFYYILGYHTLKDNRLPLQDHLIVYPPPLIFSRTAGRIKADVCDVNFD